MTMAAYIDGEFAGDVATNSAWLAFIEAAPDDLRTFVEDGIGRVEDIKEHLPDDQETAIRLAELLSTYEEGELLITDGT